VAQSMTQVKIAGEKAAKRRHIHSLGRQPQENCQQTLGPGAHAPGYMSVAPSALDRLRPVLF
jgi:hypothetical protein